MKTWEDRLIQHILNEKYLGEEDKTPSMSSDDKRAFMEAVANYQQLGKMVYATGGLREVAKTLGNIVDQAENITIQESEHWFDNVTVSRHMKQLREAYKVFEKTADEMSQLQQRLESSYDDMGMILNRYYKMNEALKDEQA